jgi:SRSO17 transposase
LKKRYFIDNDVSHEGCLVTPENFLGMIGRLKNFIEPFITHLWHQIQRDKIFDYIKGLLSDVERKNAESISYFHGYDRKRLQSFIGQVEWDDEIILDKLVKKVANMIGEQNGILILDPTTFPKECNNMLFVH